MDSQNIYIQKVAPFDDRNVLLVNDIYILASATAEEMVKMFNEAEHEEEHRQHLIQIDALMAMFPQYAKQISVIKSIHVGGKLEVLFRDGTDMEIHRVSENLVYGLWMNTSLNRNFATSQIMQPIDQTLKNVEENRAVQCC